jgi:TonB family protein
MHYGHRFYFLELRHARRRLALWTLALHAGALALALLAHVPLVRTFLRPPERPIVRIGYEGPDRYVERIILASQSRTQAPLVDVGTVNAMPSRAGGGGENVSKKSRATRSRSSSPANLGDDAVTTLAEARARMANVPLVQSTELVIESMIQPRYPENLHAKGIEGRVAIMALIDTTGFVADVSVVSASGYHEFEESAMEAVRRAKFRPYRVEGLSQEVYAVIRYRFRIY